MAKKEQKKGSGKKKKKVKEKKSGLSNREREIYLLTIAELQHKIEWRNHMRAIIEEDLKSFNNKLQMQQKDKTEAIKMLEESIEEQRGLTQKIQRALPDAESAKSLGEERRARELAAKLLQMNEERLSNNAEIDELRKRLNGLETYNPIKIDEKIKDIERQLEAEDVEDIFLKAEEQDIRRKEAFRKEMQDILQKESDSFQAEITGKLDKNFERITEETRWWADTVNGLRTAAERLEVLNDTKSVNLKAAKMQLKERKDISLRESQKQQERDAVIEDILLKIEQLESEKKELSKRQDNENLLDGIASSLKQDFETQDNYLAASFNQMKANEDEIKDLEEMLSSENLFGNQLQDYIKKAQQIIMEEVKQSLILTYDGPPSPKNTVEEMRCLFKEATKFIYERKNRTMI